MRLMELEFKSYRVEVYELWSCSLRVMEVEHKNYGVGV